MDKNIENRAFSDAKMNDFSRFLSEFHRESDRGAALNAAAMLDECIGKVLKAFLLNNKSSKMLLDGFNAPLGTFSSRVAAAHAMGLIEDDEQKQIDTIRKIRNEFGHKWKDVSFEAQKIVDLTNNLPWLGPQEMEEKSTPRHKFNFAVLFMVVDLMRRSRLVKDEKIKTKEWG